MTDRTPSEDSVPAEQSSPDPDTEELLERLGKAAPIEAADAALDVAVALEKELDSE